MFQADDFVSVTTDYNQMISTEESNGMSTEVLLTHEIYNNKKK